MSAQRYTDPIALERLSKGTCPVCGQGTRDHGGWGGPGCTLTDNGVAERVYQFQKDQTAKAAR